MAVVFALMWTGVGKLTSAYAQDTAPKVIRAQMFAVEDKDGKTRARLFMSTSGPVLHLCDKNNKASVIQSIPEPEDTDFDGPTLELRDANGKSRVNMFVSKNGNPALFLHDETGISGVRLMVDNNTSGLVLKDGKGNISVSLFQFKDGSGIASFGDKKVINW